MSAPPHVLTDIVQPWLTAFQSALSSGDVDAVLRTFHNTGSFWRDLFCLSWAIRSLAGLPEIGTFLRGCRDIAVLQNLEIDVDSPRRFQPLPGMPPSSENGVLATFRFSVATPPAVGRGLVRLLKAPNGTWAATTLLTKMEDLVGHEEKKEYIPTPETSDLGARSDEDCMRMKQRAVMQDLDVLIGASGALVSRAFCLIGGAVGAGQSGLMLAARLWQNGLNALVIDKHPRVGDSWRQRYPSLALHSQSRYPRRRSLGDLTSCRSSRAHVIM